MTVVRCASCRLFYDLDKYNMCPHCGEPFALDEKKGKEEAEAFQQNSNTYGIFGEDDKKTEIMSIVGESPTKSSGTSLAGGQAAGGGRKTSNDDDKTHGWFEIKTGKNATAGWLVCIKGCHFGESFNIYVGRNTVGRNQGNRIVIPLDGAISREKHIWITYDPKKRKFSVQPGDGANIAYVNASSILESMELKKNDILEIGKSQFILIPLCDDNFSWENYINGEQGNE